MNSSFLCVIVILLIFQVFAQNNALEDKRTRPPPPPTTTRPEKIKHEYLLCAEKTRVSPETIVSIKEGDWKDKDPKAKAWVQCVLKKLKLMTDQSVFRQDVAFKFFSDLEPQPLEENIDKCLPNNITMPPVEISWEFAKCFQTADPENSVF